MKQETKEYFVAKPIVHKHVTYVVGSKLSLNEREAQFLLLAGKISTEKPQAKKGKDNV
ncbi:hypothetical protein IMCC1989_2523 [gamma proteobacterium IMCC1989]|nr:hypothetical protein IMCC1989_2523 [gamma proteobacterium IMCC1989]